MNTLSRFETSNYDDLNRIWHETSFVSFAMPNYGEVVNLVSDDSILITN